MRCLLPMLGVAFLALGSARADERDDVRKIERHMRNTIDAVEPSVVAIVVSHREYKTQSAADRTQGRLGSYIPPAKRFPPAAMEDARLDLEDSQSIADNEYGSGLVLDAASGLILTNYHLIEGAAKIYVRGSRGKGSYANIHAADARSDLAVLKLIEPIEGLKAVRFADVRLSDGPKDQKATVYRGMWVIAMGHPQAAGVADGSPSASWGILSNVRRRSLAASKEESPKARPLFRYGILLQTDARLTLGCSGGGLFNLDGEAIGLTSPLAAVSGADTAGGYALPLDRNFTRIIEVLKEGKEVEYGFLGVSIQSFDLREPGIKGLRVNAMAGTPAGRANIRATDVLLSVNGNPIREPDDLFLQIGGLLAGDEVELTVASRAQPIAVKLGKLKHDLPWLASVRSPSFHGLRIEDTNVRLQENGPIYLPQGVLIRDIEPNSIAAAKIPERERLWVITHVNGNAVSSPADFYREARDGNIRINLADPTRMDADKEITLSK